MFVMADFRIVADCHTEGGKSRGGGVFVVSVMFFHFSFFADTYR